MYSSSAHQPHADAASSGAHMNELVHNELPQHQALNQLPEVEAQLQQHCEHMTAQLGNNKDACKPGTSSPRGNNACKQASQLGNDACHLVCDEGRTQAYLRRQRGRRQRQRRPG